MGVLFRVFSFLVRFLLSPFYRALQAELGWKTPSEWDLNNEVKKKLEEVTKERIELALSDNLATEVFFLQVKLKKAEATIEAMNKAIASLTNKEARTVQAVNNIGSRLDAVEKKVLEMDRVDRVRHEEKFDNDSPREVDSDVIDWGTQ